MTQRDPLARRRGSRSPLSLWGTIFCSTYALLIALCFATATFGHYDSKSRALFHQLPFVLQAAVVQGLRLAEPLAWLPWPVADVLLALPMFVALYVLGSIVDRAPAAE